MLEDPKGEDIDSEEISNKQESDDDIEGDESISKLVQPESLQKSKKKKIAQKKGKV